MTRALVLLTGLVGLGIVGRASAYYRGVDALAFGVTLVMAVALLAGMLELWLRSGVIARLQSELGSLPEHPENLDATTPRLRALLRSHLERDPMPPRAPVFTPYLVGLLVMLGLLGTFLGLFETLRGAREALASSGDVDALRAGLTTPMAGLMRSFGTSAAGVASSAMLGLGSVFTLRAARRLDQRVHTACAQSLAHLSAARRQLDALEALAEQGESLPAAASALRETVQGLRALQEETREQARAAREGAAKDISGLTAAVRDELSGVRAQLEALEARGAERMAESERLLRERGEESARLLGERAGESERLLTERGEAANARAEAATERMLARVADLESKWSERAARMSEDFETHAREVAGHAAERLDAAVMQQASLEKAWGDERSRAAQAIDAAARAARESMEESVTVLGAQLDALGAGFRDAHREEKELFADRSSALLERLTSLEAGLSDSHAAAAEEVRAVMALGIAEAARAAGETVEPTVARIVTATERSAAAHLEELRAQLDEDQRARRDREAVTLEALRTHLSEVVSSLDAARAERQSADEANSASAAAHAERVLTRLTEQAERRAAADVGLLESLELHARTLSEAEAERATALRASWSEVATSWAAAHEQSATRDESRAAQLAELAARMHEELGGASALIRERLEDGAARDAAQAERAEKMLAHLEQAGATFTGAARAQAEAVEALMAHGDARASQNEAHADARAKKLLDDVGAAVSMQAERLAQFEEALAARHDAHAQALGEQLAGEARRLGEGLDVTGSMVREAAELVKAGGAELAAAVEMFTGAVEQHGEAAQRWLGGLSQVERSVEEAGEGAAVDVLGQYLARTHELFDQQLGFQQELYEQLRATRAS